MRRKYSRSLRAARLDSPRNSWTTPLGGDSRSFCFRSRSLQKKKPQQYCMLIASFTLSYASSSLSPIIFIYSTHSLTSISISRLWLVQSRAIRDSDELALLHGYYCFPLFRLYPPPPPLFSVVDSHPPQTSNPFRSRIN